MSSDRLTREWLEENGFQLVDGWYTMGAFWIVPTEGGFNLYVGMSKDTDKVFWRKVNTVGMLELLFNKFHVFK